MIKQGVIINGSCNRHANKINNNNNNNIKSSRFTLLHHIFMPSTNQTTLKTTTTKTSTEVKKTIKCTHMMLLAMIFLLTSFIIPCIDANENEEISPKLESHTRDNNDQQDHPILEYEKKELELYKSTSSQETTARNNEDTISESTTLADSTTESSFAPTTEETTENTTPESTTMADSTTQSLVSSSFEDTTEDTTAESATMVSSTTESSIAPSFEDTTEDTTAESATMVSSTTESSIAPSFEDTAEDTTTESATMVSSTTESSFAPSFEDTTEDTTTKSTTMAVTMTDRKTKLHSTPSLENSEIRNKVENNKETATTNTTTTTTTTTTKTPVENGEINALGINGETKNENTSAEDIQNSSDEESGESSEEQRDFLNRNSTIEPLLQSTINYINNGSREGSASKIRSIDAATTSQDGNYSPNNSLNDKLNAESASSTSPSEKSAFVIGFCSGVIVLFVLVSTIVFAVSLRKQQGILDIELQEKRCGKDNLQDEDAENHTKLLEIKLPEPTVMTALISPEECL